MPKELSGAQWVARFPDAGSVDALADDFRPGCERFIAALRAAGASVHVSSTRRPEERAYLMHFCWKIHKGTIKPADVPEKEGVAIDWVHRKPDGSEDRPASRQAATEMVDGYDIAFGPALHSRHTEGRAIDMTIGWHGTLAIADASGAVVTIASEPRDGLNKDLRTVGRGYGPVKHPTDPPHWSTDGH